MSAGQPIVLVLVDEELGLDPELLAGVEGVRADVGSLPETWGPDDVYDAHAHRSPTGKVRGLFRRQSGTTPGHRIALLPRTAAPGQVPTARLWLSAALLQTTDLVSHTPGIAAVVALGGRAELLAWHFARKHPETLVVAGTGQVADAVAAGQPDPALGGLRPLLERLEVAYAAIPDGRRMPVVVAGTSSAPDQVAVTVGEAAEALVALSPDGSSVILWAPAAATADAVALTGRLPAIDSAAPVDTRLDGADEPHVRLLIAPANFSGQAAAWARAVTGPGIDASNLAVVGSASPFTFPSDVVVTAEEWPDPVVRARVAAREIVPATHVLLEAMRPVVGLGTPGRMHVASVSAATTELEALLASGRSVGVVLHGSEARSPDAHLAAYPFSPFVPGEHDTEWDRRREQTRAVHEALERFPVPRFVTTPDMLDFVPGATWLPLALGAGSFRAGCPVLERERPVVLHAPSSGPLKGSAFVDDVLSALHDDGLVEYRRLHGVPSWDLLAHLRDADVVVDQVVLGNPGVLAMQALAAGRLVVGHVLPHVRARYSAELPIVEADPSSLDATMRALIADRDAAQAISAAGAAFAREFHDGRKAGDVLRAFVGR
jgi:hypothetical protein